jgi:acetoin utilization deacetylase AcuC-like enzyme
VDVLYYTHPVFHRHDTGNWHPERAARLEAADRGVASAGLTVHRFVPPEVDTESLELVHAHEYVGAVERFCVSGGGALDPDTVAGPDSWEAALRAAGAGLAAIRELSDRPDSTAFLAVRPPGHHALANRAMGFCLFNNVGVAAARLVATGSKVAVVDWDVHHGNGTQEMFWSDPNALYLSIHQYPFYPGGGALDEVGKGDAEGTIINVPMPAGTGGDVYTSVFERIFLPVLTQFEPDWILVSAGYDAHESDPLAEQRLLAPDYAVMASGLAGLVPPNRIISFLEGGYHLPAITTSVAATLQGIAGTATLTATRRSPSVSWEALEEAAAHFARYWKVT